MLDVGIRPIPKINERGDLSDLKPIFIALVDQLDFMNFWLWSRLVEESTNVS